MTAITKLLMACLCLYSCSHSNLEGENSKTAALPNGPRFLYGTGVSWGFWLGLGVEEKAKSFDQLSMDKIKEMGGNMTGANLAWVDIQPEATMALVAGSWFFLLSYPLL
jgi:hypothetical protein